MSAHAVFARRADALACPPPCPPLPCPEQVDRSVTPWLLANMHAPWYNSDVNHHNEVRVALYMTRLWLPSPHVWGAAGTGTGSLKSWACVRPWSPSSTSTKWISSSPAMSMPVSPNLRLWHRPCTHKRALRALRGGGVADLDERMFPTYNNRTDPTGSTYINIGDGGNREGEVACACHNTGGRLWVGAAASR
jgi:hypothetical protein